MIGMQNIVVASGETYSFTVEVDNPDGLSMAGAVFTYAVARHPLASVRITKGDPDVVLVAEDPPVPTRFLVSVKVDADESALLRSGFYYHELAVVRANGEKAVLMRGKLDVIPSRALA